MTTEQEWITFLEETHKIKKEIWQKHKLHFDGEFLYIPYYDRGGHFEFNKRRKAPTYKGEGKYLYGEGVAAQLWPYWDLSSQKDWVITEGELDQLTLESYGIPAVTSGSTTSFKRHFVNNFKGVIVHICYDSDEAGKAGAERLAQTFLEAGIEVYIIDLPEMGDGKDLGDFFRLGHTKEEFEELIKNARKPILEQDNNPSVVETPQRANKEDKVIYALDAPGVLEVLKQDNKLVYLTEENQITELVIVDDKIYCPPPIESIRYLIASATEVFKYVEEFRQNPNHALDLYDELLTYHKGISDLPHDSYYDLLVLWDFHCYFLDKLHFSPIIYLYAVKERGKSRTGKGCIYVSRRGIWTETVREADIIRWGNDHKAALGFDVKDAPKKFERANCDDLILARFERGSVASRTLWPERGAFRDTKTFDLFGPTIIATNRPVDDILESRSIPIDMKLTSRVFNKPVALEDALDLKHKLTAFRILHYKDQLVETDKPASGRFGDIAGSLNKIVMTFFPEKEPSFIRFLKIVADRKKEDSTDSLEAKVLETVISMEEQVKDGYLPTDIIASRFNEGKDPKFALTNDTIGRILRGLGFEKRRIAGGKRGINYDPELVEKLKLNYGLDDVSDTNDTDPDIAGYNNKSSIPISRIPSLTSQESQASSEEIEKEIDKPEINSLPGLEGYGH